MLGECEHQPYEICQHNHEICFSNVDQLAYQLIVWDRREKCRTYFVFLIIEM